MWPKMPHNWIPLNNCNAGLACIQNIFLNDSDVLAQILQDACQACKHLPNVIDSVNYLGIEHYSTLFNMPIQN